MSSDTAKVWVERLSQVDCDKYNIFVCVRIKKIY